MTKIMNEKEDNHLTKRELDILKCLTEGLTNLEIGERLNISKHTAKTYISTIIYKLRAKNRTETAYLALKKEFVK